VQDFDFERLDYYALLGVERNASSDEIKRAYRQQIIRYHPDRFMAAPQDEQEYARQRTLRINEAYATLSDFGARSAYSRKGPGAQGTVVSPPPKPQAPPPPRDHQAELYNQARAHIEAGRNVQALALLRQLQQVNPFYRDSAALIAMLEAQVQPSPSAAPAAPAAEPKNNQRVRRMIIGGALGSAAVAAIVGAAVGLRGQASRLVGGQGGNEPAVVESTSISAAAVDGVNDVPEPTSAPATATIAATVPAATSAPDPTSVPATATRAATATPEASSTSAPTASPTASPTARGTRTSTPVVESGQVLIADDFARQGWTNQEGQGWSVGYINSGTYQVTAAPGIGNIWSYRTLTGGSDYSAGVTIEADQGSAGLLVRFLDRSNYVVCLIQPRSGSYRVEQRTGGRVLVIDQGSSEHIDTAVGAENRMVVRVEANQLTLIINGMITTEAAIPGMPQTQQYGVVAAAGENTVTARFSELELRTLR
jgi:hypothetical protein